MSLYKDTELEDGLGGIFQGTFVHATFVPGPIVTATYICTLYIQYQLLLKVIKSRFVGLTSSSEKF